MTYQFIDTKMNSGSYVYRLKQIDYDGSFEYSYEVEAIISSPVEYSLLQNYPNPFNPNTSINYSIPEKAFVTLKIYDVLGNEVVELINEQKEPGNYQIDFNASGLSSGIYYYTLTAGNFTSTKKMILMK
ncbi:MAG: T9SS type A sorting domain-containing protein [Ignavibacteriales bacterium]|nr:T9SS type A sorting domain-containing protein [Ignavibacteriales bacterium]